MVATENPITLESANIRPVLPCSHAQRMSALGQKRTFSPRNAMSALPPKADIDRACRDVRFVPQADIPESGGLR